MTRSGSAAEAGERARVALRESVRSGLDPIPMLRRVTTEALRLIRSADGTAIELCDGQSLLYACAAGSLAHIEGERQSRDSTLSGFAVRGRKIIHCRNTARDRRVGADLAASFGASSVLCVPLEAGPTAIGVLQVAAGRTDAFRARDARVLMKLARFIAAAIGAAVDLSTLALALIDDDSRSGDGESAVTGFVAEVLQPGIVAAAESQAAVRRTIQERALHILHQPIVDLATGRMVGVEALARFDLLPARPPDEWIRCAHAVGLGVELELQAVVGAVETCSYVDDSCYLAINVGPSTAVDERLPRLLPEVARDRLVLEITEHDQIRDYEAFREAVRPLRESGVRVAVDDVGTGVAGLSHVLGLEPDIIKLDRVLVRGIDQDPARMALAAGIAGFARDVGASVTAEGIEVTSELEATRRLGIPAGQGYFFGRPVRPPAHVAGPAPIS